MDFINQYFLVILLAIAFVVFALIGFLVDNLKRKETKEENINDLEGAANIPVVPEATPELETIQETVAVPEVAPPVAESAPEVAVPEVAPPPAETVPEVPAPETPKEEFVLTDNPTAAPEAVNVEDNK